MANTIDLILKKASNLKEVIVIFYNKHQLHRLKKPLVLSFLAFSFLAIFVLIFTYVYFLRDLSTKESIINSKDAGLTLLDSNNEPFFSFYNTRNEEYVPLSEISPVIQQAVIASEDKDFYTNPGFSVSGILRALLVNISHGKIKEGGSTITQQLVKNSLLSPDRSLIRKYQEIVLAYEINRRFNKDDILEMYLNSAYFGEGAFGIENASKTYFGKSAKDLALSEASLLAAILPAPSSLSPLSNELDKSKQRQKLILNDMVEGRYIKPQEAESALQEKLHFANTKEDINVLGPHFALMVKQELINKYGEEYVIRSGFTVRTTLNSTWQRYAQNVVGNQVNNLRYQNVTNGAAVAIDPKTGEVKVMVGSSDWFDENTGKINMALSPRQPGSSFKPIIYAGAFENRLVSPATILSDTETTFAGGYKPEDFDKKHRGPVTVRRALANSLNIPSVHIMEKLGVVSGLQIAERLGISTLKDSSNYGPSFVLGTGEVNLLELSNAFAVFANYGIKNNPVTILDIKDKYGKTIYIHQPKSQRVLEDGVAYLISSILSDNSTRSEVFGSVLDISRKAAVKTGTTESFKDSLTVGYTPSLVVGAWVGNSDNSPMSNVAGSLGAAPIWKSLMQYYLSDLPKEDFIKPDSVRELQVCVTRTTENEDRKNKNKDEENSEENGEKIEIHAYTEYFLSGMQPDRTCDSLDRDSQSHPPSDSTPTPTDTSDNQPTPTDLPIPTDPPTEEPTPTPTLTEEFFIPGESVLLF